MADQEAKPKVTITSIYYDCLERIFDFLDLKDLLNVANTCKRLQIAAAAKFGDEHGKKRIHIRRANLFYFKNGIDVSPDDIYIADPKIQLPFLRCFGEKISHLDLRFWLHNQENTTVLYQYINQYCAKALAIITFDAIHQLLPIETLLKNVVTLNIWGGDLGHMFSSLVNWFPSLRHLDIRGIDIHNPHLAVNFPKLEHLGISMCQSNIEQIADFLNANLQLQSLRIHTYGSYIKKLRLTPVLNMIRAHQSISKLEVTRIYSSQVFAAELVQLANEHPSMVELILPDYQFTADNAIALIGQLNSLKKFEFLVQGESEWNRVQNRLNGAWNFEQENSGGLKYYITLNRIH